MSNAGHKSPSLHPSEPILTVDQESAIVAANTAACRALGATEEALMGAPFLARVAAAERQAASRMLADGFRGLTGETTLLLHAEHDQARRFLVRVIPVIREYDASRLLLLLRQLAPDRQPSTQSPDVVETFGAVVRAAHDGVPARPRISTPSGETPTVLVIDDDDAVRSTVRRLLEAGGEFRVLEAASGRQALTQLHDGRMVDLVVTDLKMEDGSGGWLLAQLAYEHPELLERTVVIAGDAEGVSAAHVASRWRCPVLGKPFSRDDLIAALVAVSGDSPRSATGR